jgi:hypothetical protein
LTTRAKHIETTKQIRVPKLSHLELVALTMTAQHMSINFELQLFRSISDSILEQKIERSVLNKRRKNTFPMP